MNKLKYLLLKIQTNGLLATLALVVIAAAETNSLCGTWFFGQEDIPEELL